MAAYFLVFLVIWKTRTKYPSGGFALFTYLTGYGVARFLLDFFRGDPASFAWGIQAAQVFGAAMFVAALIGFLLLRNKAVRFAR
jgi:prolipoprotein diacylglyceryltransferase